MRLPLLLIALSTSLTAQVPPGTPPLRHETIRGTITAAGRPLDSATVTITRAPDRAFKSTKSDPHGNYSIEWADGTGDYLVHVAATGFVAARKRVTRSGDDTVFVVDFTLNPPATAQPQQLGPVVST